MSWRETQDKLAEDKGLAIILVDDKGLSDTVSSNDNSLCQTLSSSEEFSSECARFCGSVYNHAIDSKGPFKYKCFAGLECVAIPFETKKDKKLVAVTGRAFTKLDDYQKASKRASSGDWKDFSSAEVFKNILFATSTKNMKKIGEVFTNLSDEEKKAILQTYKSSKVNGKRVLKTEKKEKNKEAKKIDELPKLSKMIEEFKTKGNSKKVLKRKNNNGKELIAWRSFFNSILNLSYKEACSSVLKFISKRYDISSLAWLENKNNQLEKMLAIGDLKQQKIKISLPANDKRLLRIFRKESSIKLQESSNNGKDGKLQTVSLFPIAIGDEIKSALVIGENSEDEKVKRKIARFCQTIAPELEVLRLRKELSMRAYRDEALKKFNKSLQAIDTDDFWTHLMQTSAELLQAERGSLLIYDEKEEKLKLKAAIGERADIIKKEPKVGDRIAKKVWESGEILVVEDIDRIKLKPSPKNWEYRSDSFISYPISIGEKKIGVLNVTDKIDRKPYTNCDLKILKSITPQLAVAIDRTNIKIEAGEFKQLSVTDSLTGLLNRRYLEQRLAEEIKRSNRHGYPMSFLMIDVDNFKSYNDAFTHPEGDKALQLVAQCLRETLRGADVAARYGGEEFSILLPQTNLKEAQIIAERIREKVATTQFPNRQITISLGVATVSSKLNTVDGMISAADEALFEAKRKGRNAVSVYKPPDV